MNKKKFKYFLSIFFIIIFFISCRENRKEIKEIDFSKTTQIAKPKIRQRNILNVAIAEIITPKETYIYYKELLNYLSEKLDVDIILIQKPSYREINDLIISGKVDIAFICTGALMADYDKLDVIAIPMIQNKPYYQAYIITNKDSPIKNFKQLRNKSFAYTDPLSNTGKMFAEKLVKQLHTSPKKFFSNIIYSHAHDNSIKMIRDKIVHGAGISSTVYLYLKKRYPARVKNIKIIKKSELYGAPPIVASQKMNKKLENKIKKIFIEMNEDSIGKKILKKLMIDKYISFNDTIYNSTRKLYEYLKK